MLKTLKFFLGFCISIATLVANSAFSQDNSSRDLPTNWKLEDCISYAMKYNITLNSQKLNLGTSEQNLLLSKYAGYPNLSAAVSQGVSNSKGIVNSFSNYGLNSSLALYNGNYYRNDILSKELAICVANLELAAAENDITLQITQAYLNILLSKENIEYLKELVTASEAQLKQAEEKNTIGTIAKKDLLQIQASLSNDKYNLVMAENSKRQNILALKQLLQLPSNMQFDVVSPEIPEMIPKLNSLEEAQKTAVQTLPQVKSSEIEIQIQDIELKKIKAGFLPSLYLSGSLSSNYSKATNTYNAYNSDSYLSQLDKNFYQQIGLSLSIPIFERKTNKISLSKSKIQKTLAELKLQSVILNVNQTVERAYINVINAKNQLEAASQQLNFTKESYRLAIEQIKIGVCNNVEYLQQKSLYIQAVQSFLQAKYTLNIYQKIYNFYQGVPITQ